MAAPLGPQDCRYIPAAVKIGKAVFYAQAQMSLDEAYVGEVMAWDAEAGIGAFIAKSEMQEWTGK
ncbi:hypothetical protein [Tritonibacter scottomollicae]|uniref:Uncharacterized protein n=1 Tax=Tritonibacter scottomollicae TaxID=483013 RepID=A0A2T1AFV1_TRISK|nr:hypothetical protein [Tritonibacter scottomollicae]PRZ47218.1 hypothetical protein CLV89_10765 [Tritonibacter scottomollicae]